MEKIITCPHCHTQFDLSINPTSPDEGSNYLWIFDNGHGGMIDGVYQTPGKRSPVWPDGTQLFEGEFNRAIVDRLVVLCKANGIDYVNLVDTPEDVPLSERTSKANSIAKASEKPCIYVSIHADAFSDESANGWSVYTSPGTTKSDGIATILFEKAAREFTGEYMRSDKYSDGDVDKEAKFTVLMDTNMPAILSENFFMTNSSNCHNYLLPEEGRDRVAKIHFEMIQQVEAENKI
jgi:N-acetylmuramoyl-L-alanine amidase